MTTTSSIPNLNTSTTNSRGYEVNPSKKAPVDNYQYVPKNYKNVAKKMESQFLEFMLKKMKDSITTDEPVSSEREFYDGLLNTEHANNMSETNRGKGIQKLILDEIYPQRLRNKYTYESMEKRNAQNNFNHPKVEMSEPDLSVPKITIHKPSINVEKNQAIKAYQQEQTYE